MDPNQNHADKFDETTFLGNCKQIAKKAGREVVGKGLQLFYAFPSAPPWAKATIAGALGYLIFPADAIPDFLPAVGFTDDLGVIVAALGAVASSIDDEVKAKAAQKLEDWGM
jgi:uncharacterized membrane protein YkvA (DUF1232 family)